MTEREAVANSLEEAADMIEVDPDAAKWWLRAAAANVRGGEWAEILEEKE